MNGLLHRVDGPAIEYADGRKYWYQHGNLHRVDGPAVERPDGSKHWYLNFEKMSEAEHRRRTTPSFPSSAPSSKKTT